MSVQALRAPVRGVPGERVGLGWAWGLAIVGFVMVWSVVTAYLVSEGFWYLAPVPIVGLAMVVVLHRHPLVGIWAWMILASFVVVSEGGGVRKLYWLVHRLLPVAVLAIVAVGAAVGTRRRPLPRLGGPELLMAAYVVLTGMSIAAMGLDPLSPYHLYDRVVVPMCLYLTIRLTEPGERELRWILGAAIFVLLCQSVLGVMAWVSPGAIPTAWHGRLETRTIGSLGHPNVFSTTVLFGGLYALYWAVDGGRRALERILLVSLFALACVMALMSYGRANWLALIVVLLGVSFLYPRVMLRLALVTTLLGVLLLRTDVAEDQLALARVRFRSESSEASALSRLPVMYASLRMLEARPITGWGYGNFDQYDRRFQAGVGGLVIPDKDHASHNLYLTLLAEQGVLGFALYLGPAIWLLARTRGAMRRLRADGSQYRHLLVVLWLVIAGHVVVNNFSNMHIVYGLGMWWLTLGLIASIISRASASVPVAARITQPSELTRGVEHGPSGG